MKTIFDKSTRDGLIVRTNSLNEDHEPLWGKMTVGQMTKHLVIWNEWVLGKGNHVYKQEFMGKIFGKMMLKKHSKDDTPMSKGMPAGVFAVKENAGGLEQLKRTWAELLETYMDYSNPGFIHDFYGEMTKEQIGILVYKHSDHHLRQFDV